MSRSVSYLSNANHVAYINGNYIQNEYDWNNFKENITVRLQEMFKSLEEANRWDDNETHIFLENEHAEVGISEYCGLVSVSIRHKEYDGYGYDQTGLHKHWVDVVADKFLSIGELRKVGTFSNGEGVYERVTA